MCTAISSPTATSIRSRESISRRILCSCISPRRCLPEIWIARRCWGGPGGGGGGWGGPLGGGSGPRHESGLMLYTSTTQHAVLSKDVPSDRLSAFLGLLAAYNQDVVIDVPHAIDNLTATAFGVAAEIYIVLQQSTLHIRNSVRLIRILRDELGVQPQRLKVLINRVSKSSLLLMDDIARAVGMEIAAVIPNHYQQALESSDSGVPLYEVDRNAAITISLMNIVAQMTGEKTERPALLRRAFPSSLRNSLRL